MITQFYHTVLLKEIDIQQYKPNYFCNNLVTLNRKKKMNNSKLTGFCRSNAYCLFIYSCVLFDEQLHMFKATSARDEQGHFKQCYTTENNQKIIHEVK